MRLLYRNASAIVFFCSTVLSIATPGLNTDASSETAMLQADREFVNASARGDKTALQLLLDSDFTWTDSLGSVETNAQILQGLPKLGISADSGIQVKQYDYGQIGDVQENFGRMHVVRVWVKRPAGWKAIVYQEVASLEAMPSFSPGPGKDCQNPCKMVAYKPTNEAEKGVISSYEKLETSAFENNSAEFKSFAADEFVAASSNSNKVYDKRGRIEDLDRVKKAGLAPTPLSSARMFDFENVVLMISLHTPDRGKPLHVTRIWVKRNGHWQEALSYQTSIQQETGWDPSKID